eukprot:gnl/Chilomastix_cuspidata/7221.p1 GENE.gnl/Chilomastix_cuspidata/7221~~gnl/Chilomastix_cuspidata/7221.p1  ORF type:complete len:413 (-),score=-0.13 gnl/Chilomastix_cuspidata/7221:22-1260(-)
MKNNNFFEAPGAIIRKNVMPEEIKMKGKRLKLHEIRGHYHCSVVGTCLSLKELEKIKRKARVDIPNDSTEHEIHGIFVYLAGEDTIPSRLMTKHLDKKYARDIKEFSRLKKNEDIWNRWKEESDKGNIPGPYWALMTHPCSSFKTLSDAFGEVHMLSHLIGRSNRADIKRVQRLEEEKDNLSSRLKSLKNIYSGRFKDLNKKYENEKRKSDQLFALLDDAENEISALKQRLVRYESDFEQEITDSDNDELESQLDQAVNENILLKDKFKVLQNEVKELNERNRVLELMFSFEAEGPAGGTCRNCSCSECPGLNLCGKKVLYVGGRKKILPKCKEIVENKGGEFIHHDGGVESSKKSIDNIVSSADFVFCPIDCTSHDACLRLKKICRKTDKSFIPLRSSGVSTFVRYIQENN